MTILAMNDFRRPRQPRAPRSRQTDTPAAPAPPVVRTPVPAYPMFAVPGHATTELASMVQLPNHHEPGRVACWLTCLVCEARHRDEYTQDGRPVYEGGTLDVHGRTSTGERHVVSVGCRCPAGLASGAPPATDRQFRVAVRWRKARQMRGLLAISDETIFKFLIVPRRPYYRVEWDRRCVEFNQAGATMHIAWRKAVIAIDWDWQRRVTP